MPRAVLPAGAEPLKPGTKAWAKECKAILKITKGRAFCGQSGGKTKRGQPCRSTYVTEGNGKCRVHGGAALVGTATPHFKTGRQSRLFSKLPERFQAAFNASVNDDTLLSLRTDISISDARVEELLERLDSGESELRWDLVRTQVRKLKDEMLKTDTDLDVVGDIQGELENLVNQDAHDRVQWSEIRDQTEFRRKLVETESKRLKDLNAHIAAEDALVVIMRLVDVIIRHVEDKGAVSAIMLEVEQLIGVDERAANRAKALKAAT